MLRRQFVAGAGAAALLAAPASAQQNRPFRLVILGDSLTAGLGLAKAEAFPAQVQALLWARGLAVRVIAAGVSGDTIADGLARLDWSIPAEADGVLVALGANDMLQGIDPARSRRDLDAILKRLQARGKPFALAGMRAAPNLGARYLEAFEGMYRELAQTYQAPLYPFLLEGVALDPALNQADAFHPNAAGARRLAEKLTPFLMRAFKLVPGAAAAGSGG